MACCGFLIATRARVQQIARRPVGAHALDRHEREELAVLGLAQRLKTCGRPSDAARRPLRTESSPSACLAGTSPCSRSRRTRSCTARARPSRRACARPSGRRGALFYRRAGISAKSSSLRRGCPSARRRALVFLVARARAGVRQAARPQGRRGGVARAASLSFLSSAAATVAASSSSSAAHLLWAAGRHLCELFCCRQVQALLGVRDA